MSIKELYTRLFPDDTLAGYISSAATFAGLLETLYNGGNVYKYIGVADSVVRERVFTQLSIVTGLSYDEIYDLWE